MVVTGINRRIHFHADVNCEFIWQNYEIKAESAKNIPDFHLR